MPAARDDKKTGTDPKAHTPAYTDGFSPNTEKLCHITRFSTKAVQGYLSDINATSSVTAQTNPVDARSPKDLVKRVASNTSEFAGGVRAILEFLPVLMVAITEAYLKDVLVYAAGMDPTLMERSEQSALYNDLLNATSLEDAKEQLRHKWARSFTDSRGPAAWIKSLQKMGARGYRTETSGAMEALWGVRHLIIHSASLVTHEFVRRHPNFQIAVGSRFIVNKNHLSQWYGAVLDFVEVTDRYFLSRCVRDESKGESSIRSGLKIA
jgi:hypothetical protein